MQLIPQNAYKIDIELLTKMGGLGYTKWLYYFRDGLDSLYESGRVLRRILRYTL